MIASLLCNIGNPIPFDELQQITYDVEIISAIDGSLITQFAYFTLHSNYGEFIEIHPQDPRFNVLYLQFCDIIHSYPCTEKQSTILYTQIISS